MARSRVVSLKVVYQTVTSMVDKMRTCEVFICIKYYLWKLAPWNFFRPLGTPTIRWVKKPKELVKLQRDIAMNSRNS